MERHETVMLYAYILLSWLFVLVGGFFALTAAQNGWNWILAILSIAVAAGQAFLAWDIAEKALTRVRLEEIDHHLSTLEEIKRALFDD